MPKGPTRAEAEAILRGEDRRKLYALLKALPLDVDPQLAATGALRYLGESSWGFARACKRLPLPVIQAIVAELPQQRSPMATFLGACVPGQADLEAAWERALTAVLDLDLSYAWRSKQRRAKFAALAKDPQFVGALQATAVGWPGVRPDVLAVLAIEAREASLDSLMPHFERAARDKGNGLDLLERLKTHATLTGPMKQLFARVEAMLADRKATSPALDLARALGFDGLGVFWFSISVYSAERGTHRYFASLRVDSRDADWFQAYVRSFENRTTSFSSTTVHRDELELGTCGPDRFPHWLASIAKRFSFTWDLEAVTPYTQLRGKNRARLVAWLSSAVG